MAAPHKNNNRDGLEELFSNFVHRVKKIFFLIIHLRLTNVKCPLDFLECANFQCGSAKENRFKMRK